ncbi:hypothetical protein SAMN05421872_102366 [Nocardioides lianchengensis]|uniref:Uncharacterized protein n=1 Tax=Nocardioides lianchengensis TaxID=1045774 RepID=A0A1G6LVB1_9ACTN|nr:hypothetical protein [Nocardioides lianchengensis]SDC46994.1 hypothetical protein SAMN05421872_102366 [Nocardioides lianchengensis]
MRLDHQSPLAAAALLVGLTVLLVTYRISNPKEHR